MALPGYLKLYPFPLACTTQLPPLLSLYGTCHLLSYFVLSFYPHWSVSPVRAWVCVCRLLYHWKCLVNSRCSVMFIGWRGVLWLSEGRGCRVTSCALEGKDQKGTRQGWGTASTGCAWNCEGSTQPTDLQEGGHQRSAGATVGQPTHVPWRYFFPPEGLDFQLWPPAGLPCSSLPLCGLGSVMSSLCLSFFICK